MKLERYYTFRVPCLSKIREANANSKEEVRKLEKMEIELYRNPNLFYSFDPEGVTIISGLFKPYRGDKEFANMLKKNIVYSKDIPPEILSLALKSEILLPLTNLKTEKIFYKEVEKTFFTSNFYCVLEITSRCNLKCAHCYFYKDRNKGNEPTSEELLQRIKKLKDWGVVYVEVTGGEPTLREDLPIILTELINSNIPYYLPTNGIGITNIPVKLLKEANTITISIDGDESFHDKFRGVKGSYKTAVKALEYLSKSGIRPMISTTVTDENIEYLKSIINLGLKYKADVMFSRVIRTGAALINDLNFSRENEFEEDSIKQVNEIKVIQKMLRPSKIIPLPAFLYSCDYGRKTFGIAPDGRILYCIYNRDAKNIGYFDEYKHPSDFLRVVQELITEKKKKIKECANCDYGNCGSFCDLSKVYLKKTSNKLS
jgi:MoaA/NifB/PqqE/SkfB family radical SAM enzyme